MLLKQLVSSILLSQLGTVGARITINKRSDEIAAQQEEELRVQAELAAQELAITEELERRERAEKVARDKQIREAQAAQALKEQRRKAEAAEALRQQQLAAAEAKRVRERAAAELRRQEKARADRVVALKAKLDLLNMETSTLMAVKNIVATTGGNTDYTLKVSVLNWQLCGLKSDFENNQKSFALVLGGIEKTIDDSANTLQATAASLKEGAKAELIKMYNHQVTNVNAKWEKLVSQVTTIDRNAPLGTMEKMQASLVLSKDQRLRFKTIEQRQFRTISSDIVTGTYIYDFKEDVAFVKMVADEWFFDPDVSTTCTEALSKLKGIRQGLKMLDSDDQPLELPIPTFTASRTPNLEDLQIRVEQLEIYAKDFKYVGTVAPDASEAFKAAISTFYAQTVALVTKVQQVQSLSWYDRMSQSTNSLVLSYQDQAKVLEIKFAELKIQAKVALFQEYNKQVDLVGSKVDTLMNAIDTADNTPSMKTLKELKAKLFGTYTGKFKLTRMDPSTFASTSPARAINSYLFNFHEEVKIVQSVANTFFWDATESKALATGAWQACSTALIKIKEIRDGLRALGQ